MSNLPQDQSRKNMRVPYLSDLAQRDSDRIKPPHFLPIETPKVLF